MKSPAIADRLEEAANRSRAAGGFGLTSIWALFALTVRQHLHGKRWMVMGFLFLLPSALALLIRVLHPEAPTIWLEFMMTFMFIPQVLLPLVALVYASGIIQDEQEDQTFTYLLIRPIPKWAIYTTKLLAALTTTIVLTAIFTVLTYLVVYVGADAGVGNVPLRCLKAVAIHSLAVAAYCCLFGVLSLLTRYALVLGIVYAMIVELIIANLPFSVRWGAIIYHARLIAYRSMDFIDTGRHRSVDIAAGVWQLDVKQGADLPDHPSITTCILVLALASLAASFIAAFLCNRREFYVKTPGG